MILYPLSHFSTWRRVRYGQIPLLLLLPLWFFLSTRPAAAATIPVDGTTCTLVAAINAANNDTANGGCPAGSGADTITLQSDVALSSVEAYETGLPLISSVITVEGGGHIIRRNSNAQAFRLFYVSTTGRLTLNRITLAGGNIAGDGGGIFNDGMLTVNNSTLTENTAERGGGIFNNATVTVNNSILTKNTAGDGLGGGGIYNVGWLTVNNSTLTGNTTVFHEGGGIYNVGALTVSNSTLSGNTAGESGTGGNGGGIFNIGTLTVNNSTLTGNTANNKGGGIFNSSNTYNDGTLTLYRSLLAGNRSNNGGSEVYNLGGTVHANNYNLFGFNRDARSVGLWLGSSDIMPTVGLAQILNTTLTDNGGGTPTHALVSGSPAINAARDSGLETDQRGVPRPQGTADDIGAFEYYTPVAQDDNYTLWPAPSLIVDVAHGLLANDLNLVGQARTAIVISNPQHGSLSLNAQGDFQFTPTAGFSGTDSFTYQVSDGYARSNTATVTITVYPTARITVVLDARPESPTNLDFSGSLGTFWLDDSPADDGDANLNQRTFVVAPGAYTIRRNATSGWFNTAIVCTPATGATINLAQSSATLNLATNADATCVFTVERGVNMQVRVFNDLVRTGTNFGVVNAGDPWLNGWLISVYLTPNTLVASRLTSTNGFWGSRDYEARFVNLPPGSYTVCTTLPTAAWLSSSPNIIDPAYGKPCKAIFLAPTQSALLFFGAYQATVGASAVVTPDQEVITHVDQITDLPLTADEAAPVTAEESGQANALFLPVVVAGGDSALAESEPAPLKVLHLDADANSSDAESTGALDLLPVQDESQDGAGEPIVLDSPLDAAPTSTADEADAPPAHTLFLPLVTQ